MNNIYLALRSIPKTIIFNFKYFNFKDAIKFPVIVSHRVSFAKLKGTVDIKAPIKTGMIKIGFGGLRIFDQKKLRAVWYVTGKVIFNGKASIGNGSKISVIGELNLGNKFAISANAQIECKEKITFGDNVLIGWDCLFMDGDGHKILQNGEIVNKNIPIKIGDSVWFGARTTVLKGTIINNNTVIASNSCLTGKKYTTENCILGGYPAKVIKENIEWII